MSYRDMMLKNPIVPVHWAGWQSTTLDLQQAGWEWAVEEDFATMRLRFTLRHPTMHLYGISQDVRIGGEMYFGDNLHSRHVPPIYMQGMVPRMQVYTMQYSTMPAFVAFNARPEYTMPETEVKTMEDLRIFRPVPIEAPEVKEIVVAPESVTEMLDRMLAMQSPKQREIRERMRKEGLRYYEGRMGGVPTKTDVVAQIISVAA